MATALPHVIFNLVSRDSLMSGRRHFIIFGVECYGMCTYVCIGVTIDNRGMATSYSYQPGLQQRHRSQSDSNLLSTPQIEANGSASLVRMGSVGELSPRDKKGRTRRFFHRLVRPWKWRIKRKYKDTGESTNQRDESNCVLECAGCCGQGYDFLLHF